MLRKSSRIVGALALATAVLLIAPGSGVPTPPATNETVYQLCGRVFSDPHAYWPSPAQAPLRSPWAKGNAVCASTDFLTYDDMVSGLTYLESLFPQFVEFYKLEEDFGDGSSCAVSTSNNDMCSAGLPNTLQGRDREDLYLLRVTDERVSDADKKFFTFPLAIHGIERAGAEGGTRAAEDLATWGACEAKVAPEFVDCGHPENEAPHPLLEGTPKRSVTAGKALKRSAIFMIYPNPDGWRRGERTEGTQFFMRYNGNGVDLNRDWPEQGYTFRPYTPWSEPESVSYGRVLQAIGPKDARGNPKWTGGIDLHGQLIDRAFSFTLIGGSQRPNDKNQRVHQTVKGAWSDAEKRLAWSP